MGNQSHRRLQTHPDGQKKAGTQNSMIYGHGDGKKKQPRTNSRNNTRPSRASSTATQRTRTSKTYRMRGMAGMDQKNTVITIGYTIIRKNSTKNKKNG